MDQLKEVNRFVVNIADLPRRVSDPSPESLPRTWDWRKKHYLATPESQGTCGSCWAIATAGMLQDRGNIFLESKSLPPSIPSLSHQYLLNCARNCIRQSIHEGCTEGCNGGFLAASLIFVSKVGTPSKFGEVSTECANGKCGVKSCQGLPKIAYTCDDVYQVNRFATFDTLNMGTNTEYMSEDQKTKNMLNIMREIQERGPVATVMSLFSDFEDYWNHSTEDDVYQLGWRDTINRESKYGRDAELGSLYWTSARPGPGGITYREMHAVVIVGWGETSSKIPYWIVRNSWGVSNRMSGYMLVRRGNNALGIESSVWGCWFDDARFSLIRIGDNTTLDTLRHNARIRETYIFLISIIIAIVLFSIVMGIWTRD
jgi:hypothetical protein